MLLTYLLVSLLPIVAFVLVHAKYDLKKAIFAAVLSVVLVLVYEFQIYGEIETMTLVEAGFFVLMGLISWKLNRDYLFKLQPAIVDVLLAMAIIAFQLSGKPLLIHALEKLARIDPSMRQLQQHPQFIDALQTMSWQLVVLLILHGGLVAYTALRSREFVWVLARTSIYPMLLIMSIFNF